MRLVAEDLLVLRAAADQSGMGSRGDVTLAARPESVASVLSASAEGSLRLALPADDADDLASSLGAAPTEVAPVEEGGEEPDGGDAS